MKQIAKYIALVSLVVLIVPSILYLAGKMTLDQTKWIMLLATIVWFIAATLWMWHEEKQQQ